MKSHALSFLFPTLPLKAGLAAALLASMLPVQAAGEAALPPAGAVAPDDTDKVIVSDDPVKPPQKHRKVIRAPVKPENYPTKPQQRVRILR
jgi:hypothetical protein